jgi:hypothetical protein
MATLLVILDQAFYSCSFASVVFHINCGHPRCCAPWKGPAIPGGTRRAAGRLASRYHRQ